MPSAGEYPKSFRLVLQRAVSLSDSTWSYRVADLPPPSETNRLGLANEEHHVPANLAEHHIAFQFRPISPNRAINADALDKLVLISFANFHARSFHQQSGHGHAIGTQPSTPKEGPWLKIRKSIKKSSGGDDHSFAVVQYSKGVIIKSLEAVRPTVLSHIKTEHTPCLPSRERLTIAMYVPEKIESPRLSGR
ncbi:hypothetical protein B0T26DRAFT_680709 [Lasiosphaeria miniovina]|uniref:Uncharacterized protein n=1 Tax=Lasiosphaeria miniovina TaxID=1954250 RepID=A0AA40DKK8_9PEZI|nr:uncharacterized protein B0T26DRAFT_680709 [Lasiosphaeria miniovina]KAK0707149.1 hypothetical protein B0T26DRAFT_680709 [Lasiosphaeria miniovina]